MEKYLASVNEISKFEIILDIDSFPFSLHISQHLDDWIIYHPYEGKICIY